MFEKIKEFFSKDKRKRFRINNNSREVSSFDVSHIVVPEYKKLTDEEKKKVNSFFDELKIDDAQLLINYSNSLRDFSNENVSILMDLLSEINLILNRIKLKNSDLQTAKNITTFAKAKIELDVAVEELMLVLDDIQKMKREVELKLVALDRFIRRQELRKLDFLGIFGRAERIKFEQEKSNLTEARYRMLVCLKIIEEHKIAIVRTIEKNNDILRFINLHRNALNISAISEKLSEDKNAEARFNEYGIDVTRWNQEMYKLFLLNEADSLYQTIKQIIIKRRNCFMEEFGNDINFLDEAKYNEENAFSRNVYEDELPDDELSKIFVRLNRGKELYKNIKYDRNLLLASIGVREKNTFGKPHLIYDVDVDKLAEYERKSIFLIAFWKRKIEQYAFKHRNDAKILLEALKQDVKEMYDKQDFAFRSWGISPERYKVPIYKHSGSYTDYKEKLLEYEKQIIRLLKTCKRYISDELANEIKTEYLKFFFVESQFGRFGSNNQWTFFTKLSNELDGEDSKSLATTVEEEKEFYRKIFEAKIKEIELKTSYNFSNEEREMLVFASMHINPSFLWRLGSEYLCKFVKPISFKYSDISKECNLQTLDLFTELYWNKSFGVAGDFTFDNESLDVVTSLLYFFGADPGKILSKVMKRKRAELEEVAPIKKLMKMAEKGMVETDEFGHPKYNITQKLSDSLFVYFSDFIIETYVKKVKDFLDKSDTIFIPETIHSVNDSSETFAKLRTQYTNGERQRVRETMKKIFGENKRKIKLPEGFDLSDDGLISLLNWYTYSGDTRKASKDGINTIIVSDYLGESNKKEIILNNNLYDKEILSSVDGHYILKKNGEVFRIEASR